jgi:hypothetical protein
VFLFCVVAFVLEARIYILSVSGEWAAALVWAGKRKEPCGPSFSRSSPLFAPVSHHSNQVGAGNRLGSVCGVWESFFFFPRIFFFKEKRLKKKTLGKGEGWGIE